MKLISALTLLTGVLASAVLLNWLPPAPFRILLGVAVTSLFVINLRYAVKGWGIPEIYPNPRTRRLLLIAEAGCSVLALIALVR
ncbi:hypothetical protein ACQ86G_21010 [Roseateles chitinivorans]|uniref:hypothetical protein n=1 Tax=Roseateles chitinivorans TaxID=2917965 RepID=UPI003D67154F